MYGDEDEEDYFSDYAEEIDDEGNELEGNYEEEKIGEKIHEEEKKGEGEGAKVSNEQKEADN